MRGDSVRVIVRDDSVRVIVRDDSVRIGEAKVGVRHHNYWVAAGW